MISRGTYLVISLLVALMLLLSTNLVCIHYNKVNFNSTAIIKYVRTFRLENHNISSTQSSFKNFKSPISDAERNEAVRKKLSKKTSISFVNAKEFITRYTDRLLVIVRLENDSVPISNAIVYFYAENVTRILIGTARTNSSGYAILDIPNILLNPGNYTLLAEFQGNETYPSAEARAPLTILREITKIISNVDVISLNYSDSICFSARLLTDDDEVVPNRKVAVWVFTEFGYYKLWEGESFSNGTIKIEINLKEAQYLTVGEYSLEIKFGGDNFYLPSKYKMQLRVNPEIINIYAEFIGKRHIGSQIVILISVIDNEGDPVSFATVEILINSSIFSIGNCDANGVFREEFIPDTPGVYIITVRAYHENYANATASFMLLIAGEETQQFPLHLLVIFGVLLVSVVITIISRFLHKKR